MISCQDMKVLLLSSNCSYSLAEINVTVSKILPWCALRFKFCPGPVIR